MGGEGRGGGGGGRSLPEVHVDESVHYTYDLLLVAQMETKENVPEVQGHLF